ncbi:sushi, von Willebrand factor type A, EGF and pentraxin domain-containing protein 1-like isoform X2 [Sinocyclocheilus rhinocerous]|uniref:Sushi, von Willebrand factor type A, EGF and pentraxin domain-containing protein 1-like n=1 Tax=Sinocyclocheilus rhinocerous TaxID=307959 RepID=A0A673JS62_9TELE|nr:PREDICTED: sushi, von Willebrand factor type A, EGF and pentraxin domain-containing protein 1-like isoform X2 [Sinocyclocheilus rhinocerous]
MALVWRNILILVFAHFVVSHLSTRCGEPTKYPGKQLHKSYLHKLKFNHGERVMYTCPPGYTPSEGSPTSWCLQGHWTALNLKCQKKKCNALGDVENGQYIREGQSFGDKAIATCNKGYVLRGERVRMCMQNGWSGMDPICEVSKIMCLAPAVANRWIKPGERTQYTPQDTATIVCSEGFVLTGSPQVTCGPDGQWQGLPVCRSKVITCSAPAVANGRIKPGSRVYKPKDTVDVICNEGFDLIGSPVVTCGPEGQWQALLECRPKRISATGKCGPAPSIPHAFPRDGSFTLKEYPSGARIHYKCSTGYVRARGSTSIHCLNGQWTNLQLRCERKKCGSAGEISYGQYEYTGVSFGDSATAICQEGYELTGPKVRICRDGGWDGRSPVCEPVHCPPPPEVKDAEMFDPIYDHAPFGHVVSYHCRTGALIGAREIYCTKNGAWSAPPPECKDIVCPNPQVPRGSRMRGFRAVYKYGNTVTIACNPGLRLLGESFVTCGAEGEWKPKLPECV